MLGGEAREGFIKGYPTAIRFLRDTVFLVSFATELGASREPLLIKETKLSPLPRFWARNGRRRLQALATQSPLLALKRSERTLWSR
jgi:hypothetical protein